jgi:hypothetical protein
MPPQSLRYAGRHIEFVLPVGSLGVFAAIAPGSVAGLKKFFDLPLML